MATYIDLYVDRGCTFSRTIDLTDTSNAAVDLTNYTGYGQIKKTYASSSKTDFTVTKDSNDLIIQLSEAQTKDLCTGLICCSSGLYSIKFCTIGCNITSIN